MYSERTNYSTNWNDQYEDDSDSEYYLEDEITEEELLENKYKFRAEWFKYIENFYN